jgi:hypothetical protein
MYRLKVFHNNRWFTIASDKCLEKIEAELEAAKRRTSRSSFRITQEIIVQGPRMDLKKPRKYGDMG